MYIVSCNQFHMLVVPKLAGGKVGELYCPPARISHRFGTYKLRVPYQIY